MHWIALHCYLLYCLRFFTCFDKVLRNPENPGNILLSKYLISICAIGIGSENWAHHRADVLCSNSPNCKQTLSSNNHKEVKPTISENKWGKQQKDWIHKQQPAGEWLQSPPKPLQESSSHGRGECSGSWGRLGSGSSLQNSLGHKNAGSRRLPSHCRITSWHLEARHLLNPCHPELGTSLSALRNPAWDGKWEAPSETRISARGGLARSNTQEERKHPNPQHMESLDSWAVEFRCDGNTNFTLSPAAMLCGVARKEQPCHTPAHGHSGPWSAFHSAYFGDLSICSLSNTICLETAGLIWWLVWLLHTPHI